MVLGARQLEERRRNSAAAHNTPRATGGDDPPPPAPKTYTELQVEIARAHGKTPEEYYDAPLPELKVPANPPKAKAGT